MGLTVFLGEIVFPPQFPLNLSTPKAKSGKPGGAKRREPTPHYLVFAPRPPFQAGNLVLASCLYKILPTLGGKRGFCFYGALLPLPPLHEITLVLVHCVGAKGGIHLHPKAGNNECSPHKKPGGKHREKKNWFDQKGPPQSGPSETPIERRRLVWVWFFFL
eukprot:FR743707.1.p1 GENE.FR743707.1~~FR743707.1.p1  ORF type:complete len:161 (+),score=38.10 FR743707.1:812-1294(+)